MYGAMMPAYAAPNLAQAALAQALLARAALANAQARMMPQAASGALSPFAAAAVPQAPQLPQAQAPVGLGALLGKAFPRPIISCWGGVSKEQFDLINARRTGAPLLPFSTQAAAQPQPPAQPTQGLFSRMLPGWTGRLDYNPWRDPAFLAYAGNPQRQILPFAAGPQMAPLAVWPSDLPAQASRLGALLAKLPSNLPALPPAPMIGNCFGPPWGY